MTSQPPGPPSGPLHPQPSEADERRKKRRLITWIAAGVAAVVVVVVVVVLLLPGGESGQTTTDAQKLAKDVAATPGDWGPGFSGGNEANGIGEPTVGADCKVSQHSDRTGTMYSFERDSQRDNPATAGASQVRVFDKPDTAKSFLKDDESSVQRCPNQSSDTDRWENIRQSPTEQLSGFDESVAEDGTYITTDQNGQKTTQVYTIATGRSGNVTLSATAAGDPGNEQNMHTLALDVLQKMQKHLAEKKHALPLKR
ncbi:hypothetical protein GCM10010218_03310 [Streptomyces mashuensis]|uniref:PknH-like extracellular domain-containing protein n=1 Tax=Streptomyces mashuensis TaxID=33904 RepID=A0A919AUB2_9ACTN|nr:hypothetical protein [Streptomyces mashuensis]GHF25935.1 hypothetical protein GCM10010218_03310 [Streptomyces mashuensis]